MAFRRGSEEEKAAKAAEKEREREAKARERAVGEEQARLRKAAEERDRQRQGFLASPAGEARTAFARGDRLFQFVIDVRNTKTVVVPMGGATTKSASADPVVILNSVCNEGWELVNGSFVFQELGSESRDKFLASGQNVAVKGTIIGYYLFRRCEPNRIEAHDPWETPKAERICPHCQARIDAQVSFCTTCHAQSEPWRFHDGVWWRLEEGEWLLLDATTGGWQKHEPEPQVEATEPTTA